MIYQLYRTSSSLYGSLSLNGSKSITNRALLIRALCEDDFPIRGLSTSHDSERMEALLQQYRSGHHDSPFDAGPAGTTFRFLTAFLAMNPGTQVLTGTERMKKRPVGLLVDALRKLGARIEYLGKEGYPPLKIQAPEPTDQGQITIPAETSSQYITALLLLAPCLPLGLELRLEGKIVSRPYIEMTLELQRYFGVQSEWSGNTISIPPQAYKAKPFTVEADWSAASYFYSMATLAKTVDLRLYGLRAGSLQGDAVLAEMMESFGLRTTFGEDHIHLEKSGHPLPQAFEYDFLRCPDLAQTLAVVCAATGIPATFHGLETLRIKETDRIQALETELAKVGVAVKANAEEGLTVEGKASWTGVPLFATYEDHRMAMAFAPLAMRGMIRIGEPQVVRKSYPGFWDDLNTLGFSIEEIS